MGETESFEETSPRDKAEDSVAVPLEADFELLFDPLADFALLSSATVAAVVDFPDWKAQAAKLEFLAG